MTIGELIAAYEIEFGVGNKVEIIELARKGRVVSIWICKHGTQYQVRYFDNAEAKTVYFYSDELAPVEELKGER